jgi:hypothetical protein
LKANTEILQLDTREKTVVSAARRAYLDHQNLVRGALARLKSKRFDTVGSQPFKRLRGDLRTIALSARAKLAEEDFAPFLDWTDQLLESTANEFLRARVGFEFLMGFSPKPPIVSLKREVSWISSFLKQNARKINAYCRINDQIGSDTLKGRLREALAGIEEVAESFGETFHFIQLRIAIEQRANGLEKQKEFIKELRSKFKRGVLSYVAYFTGVRVEDRTSWKRYVEMVDERLSGTSYDNELRAYLKYRLTTKLPSSELSLAAILRHEQSHSIIDLYETFIAFMQLVCEPGYEQFHRMAVDAVRLLDDIQDYRLDKLALALGAPRANPTSTIRSTQLSDALFQGTVGRAAQESRKAFRYLESDPWQIVYSAVVGAHSRNAAIFGYTTAFGMERLLASVLARDGDCLSSYGQLEKLSHIFDAIPTFRAIGTFLQKLMSDDPTTIMRLELLSLNSATLGVEDIALAAVESRPSLQSQLFRERSISERVWSAVPTSETVTGRDSTTPIELFATAVRDIQNGDPSDAIPLLNDLALKETSQPLHYIIAQLLLVCHNALQDNGSKITLIATEAARNERSPALLPVVSSLKLLSWGDYRPLAKTLMASVALDTLWRSTEDDGIATMLRYSFSYQLKGSEYNRPSEFADQLTMFDRDVLIYYLRNVCVPTVMDMSRSFRSSREVIEERQNICATLKFLDPARAEEYDDEIVAISNNLMVQDGLKLVDRSRIHVDLDAVARWAKRNIAEDYSRYSDLVAAGVGTAGDFEEILRELFATIGARQIFYTPDDQADAILADMLERTREVFLTNSDFGLDYFLSKRVRHQSFVGLIRGPLEFADLITTRESEFGPYRDNEFWLGKFGLDGELKGRLSKIFSSFSEQFDGALSNLKDRYFQIWMTETPDGLFRITLSPQMLFTIRSLLQVRFSFDEFLRGIFMIFWAALEPSLAAARSLISTDLKVELSDLLAGLREDVRSFAESNQTFLELSATIGDVSAQVQQSLDQAAAWFVRPESQQALKQYTLQQTVDIAVNSARVSHRAFEPKLSLKIDGDVSIEATDLLLITDAIFIALDNVKRHSGIRQPKVSIECTAEADKDLIQIEIVSEMNKARIADTEVKLAAIRSVVQKGEQGKRTRREGGSGFLKLASAVRQSADGKLDFEVMESGEFRLSLWFRPARYTVAVISRQK